MKALSIKQPWAWLIVNGYKDVENRTWHTNFWGKLLIHASKTFDHEGHDYVISEMGMDIPMVKTDYDLGALVGMVNMIHCVTQHTSEWFCGPYGFVFTGHLAFKKPIPYRGQLGFFNVPEDVLK